MMHAMFKVNSMTVDLTSIIVCLGTWSKVSHCELVFSNGDILNTEPGIGVHLLQAGITRHYDRYHWIPIPLPWLTYQEEKTIRNWAGDLVLKQPGYDLKGAVLGGILGWQNPDRYFCSELIVAAIHTYSLFLNPCKWYSPNSLWKALATHLQDHYPKYTELWKFRHNSK